MSDTMAPWVQLETADEDVYYQPLNAVGGQQLAWQLPDSAVLVEID